MPKAKQLIRFLHNQGYEATRQKGSHRIFTHPVRSMLSIPIHSGDVPRGLFLQILKDAGFSEKDFLEAKKDKGKE